jgi:hypothetical protein
LSNSILFRDDLDLGPSCSFITSSDPVADPSEVANGHCANKAAVQDLYGHGTHVASIIGAPVNGIGIAWVAPQATLVALKACDVGGFCFVDEVAAALRYAVQHEHRQLLHRRRRCCRPWRGLLQCDRHRARRGARRGAAQLGPVPAVRRAQRGLPGVTVEDHGAIYAELNGTSMASPHTAGVGALIRQLHPKWSPSAVAAALLRTASPMSCPPNWQPLDSSDERQRWAHVLLRTWSRQRGTPQPASGRRAARAIHGHRGPRRARGAASQRVRTDRR